MHDAVRQKMRKLLTSRKKTTYKEVDIRQYQQQTVSNYSIQVQICHFITGSVTDLHRHPWQKVHDQKRHYSVSSAGIYFTDSDH